MSMIDTEGASSITDVGNAGTMYALGILDHILR